MRRTSGLATLQFLGATETVTGSKFLLSNGTKNWLVDCGLFQGLKDLRLKNWSPLPVPPRDISSVILTHAHIDHSGYLPVFVKNGFKGEILASDATIELCKILLPDSGYLQEEDAKYATKKGFSKHSTVLPLYTYEDALDTFPFFKAVPDSTDIPLDANVSLKMLRAGHILGSRFVLLTVKGKTNFTILFAGDIGGYDSLITSDPEEITDDVDYLVMESTYGAHKHPDEDPFKRFEKIITETIAKNGKILIPAFAVGRTQEIIFILKRLRKENRIPHDLPVYLNTPLGIDATAIYTKYARDHRLTNGKVDPYMFQMPNLHFVHEQEDSKELNSMQGPAIILSASGMLTGGRILHHLKAYAGDPNNCLVIVGFQAAGTRGRAILDGAKMLKIHGHPVGINCRIEHITSLSAHGDSDDIMKWLGKFKRPPKKIFLVHGEPDALASMLANINEHFPKVEVQIPRFLEKVELS